MDLRMVPGQVCPSGPAGFHADEDPCLHVLLSSSKISGLT